MVQIRVSTYIPPPTKRSNVLTRFPWWVMLITFWSVFLNWTSFSFSGWNRLAGGVEQIEKEMAALTILGEWPVYMCRKYVHFAQIYYEWIFYDSRKIYDVVSPPERCMTTMFSGSLIGRSFVCLSARLFVVCGGVCWKVPSLGCINPSTHIVCLACFYHNRSKGEPQSFRRRGGGGGVGVFCHRLEAVYIRPSD